MPIDQKLQMAVINSDAKRVDLHVVRTDDGWWTVLDSLDQHVWSADDALTAHVFIKGVIYATNHHVAPLHV